MSVMVLLPLLMFAAAAAGEPPIKVVGHAWAPFISPMGEPFRARTVADDTLANWFRQADRNHDGQLTLDEMQADADRFFATLDADHDGAIDPDELSHYEWEVAPEIQVMSRTRRPAGQPAAIAEASRDEADLSRAERKRRESDQEAALGIGGGAQGASRYALLDIPQPVASADTDFNRLITVAEFRAAAATRFALLDRMHRGSLSLDELEAMKPALPGERPRRRKDAPDQRIGNPLPPGG